MGFPIRRFMWFGLIVLGLLPQKLFADFSLISPGPLAEPHASVEGQGDCLKCHQEGKQVVGGQCLACHTELQGRIAQQKGYHGHLDQLTNRCGKCHPDHAGRAFKLIQWEGGKEKFDHETTGYSLKGSHAGVACARCHDARLVREEAIRDLIARHPKKETYLGLSGVCKNCHFDEHRGQLTADCGTCHDEGKWKETPGFSHQRTRYPLVGKHYKVACDKCHSSAADTTTPANPFPLPIKKQFMKLTGIPFSSCEDCHKDVHEGKFGKECESCHTPNHWHDLVNKKVKGREFHEKTRYPLRGAHALVECRSCHGPFGKTPAKFKGLKFEKCSDCHMDAHEGQLNPTLWKDCNDCHSVNSFTPVEFNLSDHARTRYPLEGGHRAVACSSCHPQKKELIQRVPESVRKSFQRQGRPLKVSLALFRFSKSLQACETCHADPHNGQYLQNGAVKRCDQCHQVQSFKDLKFDHGRDSRYPLTGKHAKVVCGGCHLSDKGATRYRPISFTCETCHADIHLGQLKSTSPGKSACENCHTTEDFKKKLLFNHNEKRFTSFSLNGKHSSVKCDKCHVPVPVAANVRTAKYKPIARTCDGCHVDTHKGAFNDFVPSGGVALVSSASPCAKCHTESAWEFAAFNHSKTGFPLKGKHQTTLCRKCHEGGTHEKRIDQSCRSCHKDVHAGQLGIHCEKCHDENGWRGNFGPEAHRRTNFPLTGRHALIPCEECHQEKREKTFSRAALECYGCHQADYAATATRSIDHAAFGFGTNCRDCHHPTRWKPASFPDHNNCFPITRGAHAGISCLNCHNSLTGVTATGACSTGTTFCGNCHTGAHTQSKMDGEHGSVPGYQYKDTKCYGCHHASN